MSHDTDQSVSEHGNSHRRIPRVLVAVAGIVLILLVGVAFAIHRERVHERGIVRHAIITQGSIDSYEYRRHGSTIEVTAVPEVGPGTPPRSVFWEYNAKRSVNQESCITWMTPDGRAQPGMALRINPATKDKQAQALIVTQNVWGGAFWNFWLLGATGHGRDPAGDSIAKWDMYHSVFTKFDKLKPGPWRACARVVGTHFSFKVWTLDTQEPSWTSPLVRHATLPEKWVIAGYPGAYVGHITPEKSFSFKDLTTRGLTDN